MVLGYVVVSGILYRGLCRDAWNDPAFQLQIVAVIGMLCWWSGPHQIEYHIKNVVSVILSYTTSCDRCRQPRMLDRKRIGCKLCFFSL